MQHADINCMCMFLVGSACGSHRQAFQHCGAQDGRRLRCRLHTPERSTQTPWSIKTLQDFSLMRPQIAGHRERCMRHVPGQRPACITHVCGHRHSIRRTSAMPLQLWTAPEPARRRISCAACIRASILAAVC